MKIKRWLALGLMLICLNGAACAIGEETVSLEGKASFPADAEYIDLGAARVTDWEAFPDFLSRFPNLRKVDMFESPIIRRRANALAERFPQIEFGWTLRIVAYDHEHRVRTDATAFSTLHNNKTTEHTDEELSVLRYCKQLRALDIGHNQVTDLSFLYELPELRVLIIACNRVTDLTPVGSLQNLEYLELFKNRVTDLSPLSGLTRLMDLNFCYNKIEDVTPLYGMTSLRRVWCGRSAYYRYGDQKAADLSRETVGKLKEALPTAQIDAQSSSTAGGWREHPHYDVIYRMFKTGEYIPFEESEPSGQICIMTN